LKPFSTFSKDLRSGVSQSPKNWGRVKNFENFLKNFENFLKDFENFLKNFENFLKNFENFLKDFENFRKNWGLNDFFKKISSTFVSF
jgi:hypothetical protein